MPLPLPPAARVKQAAAQRTDQGPSRAVVSKRGSGFSSKYLSGYNEWQDWARRYSRTLGAVRFSNAIIADTCKRCDLRVEERDAGGDWVPVEDGEFAGIFDHYRNDLLRQDASELVRAHAWHYQIAGELCQVTIDGRRGPEFLIVSARSIEFDRPRKGMATVKFTPSGDVKDETAIVVDRQAIIRFWIPDEEFLAYATSPMAASIDDLHRLWALNRNTKRTADSRLIQNGGFWTPAEAHEDDGATEDDEPGAGEAKPRSALETAFYAAATRAIGDDDDILAVAPYMFWWSHEYGAGTNENVIDFGRDLDPNGLSYKTDALSDYGRGVNLPASLVVGGGPGDANHWTEWLVDKKFFDNAAAPTMDRVTHEDLTASFLVPYCVLNGIEIERRFLRVGYDATPVLVEPDQSDDARALYMIGLLNEDATLRAHNFDPQTDRMRDPAERERLLEILAKGQDASPFGVRSGPADRSTTDETPPTSPEALPISASAEGETLAVEAPSRARRLLERLAAIRRDVGRELLAGAEVALASALRHAGVKIQTRARSRKTAVETRAALASAVAARAPLGPFFAAVGITELEALDGQFDAFEGQAARVLARGRARQERAVRQAGLDPDQYFAGAEANEEQASGFLGASLTALAVRRLADGPAPIPARGEVRGDVPAGIVKSAISVAQGEATATLGETADAIPDVALIPDATSLEAAIFGDVEEAEPPIEYAWEHGFYGDPTRPFEPHEDLGAAGFTTTAPGPPYSEDVDPDLFGDSPFGDHFAPGDHDGCTCEWVPVGGVESGPGDRPVLIPS